MKLEAILIIFLDLGVILTLFGGLMTSQNYPNLQKIPHLTSQLVFSTQKPYSHQFLEAENHFLITYFSDKK